MSPPNTYEGRTIEEALRAAQDDLGEGVQIVDASRERTGGLFGFFARERFRVVASSEPVHAVEPAEAGFADVLRAMADGVTDVYERAAVATPTEDRPEIDLRDEDGPPIDLSESSAASSDAVDNPTAAGTIGLIDLRERRRIQVPAPTETRHRASAPGDASFDFSGRPSKLRELLRDPSGPRDAEWSVGRLRGLGIPMSIVARLAVERPITRTEWIRALANAIAAEIAAMPERDAAPRLVADGHSGAVELIRAIELGVRPGELVIDGVARSATPEQLAISVAECLR